MAFDLDGYNTVPERIAEFRAKHPEGCLRPLDASRPYWLEQVGDKWFVVYAAAAYRAPDDPTPGVGVAWEPFPGGSPFTKDSELMNAETSAWGRAIVACLAADTQKGIATREEAEARRAPLAPEKPVRAPRTKKSVEDLQGPPMKPGHALAEAAAKAGFTPTPGMTDEAKADLDQARRDVLQAVTGKRSTTELDPAGVKDALAAFAAMADGTLTLAYDKFGAPYLREEPF